MFFPEHGSCPCQAAASGPLGTKEPFCSLSKGGVGTRVYFEIHPKRRCPFKFSDQPKKEPSKRRRKTPPGFLFLLVPFFGNTSKPKQKNTKTHATPRALRALAAGAADAVAEGLHRHGHEAQAAPAAAVAPGGESAQTRATEGQGAEGRFGVWGR